MPNTFVHLGMQTLTSKVVLKEFDFKWIAVGCIIPDIPWIMQRIFLMAPIGMDQHDMLNYFSAQASLFNCLIFSGILALLAGTRRIFFLLAANSLLHLLIDAVQTKWANGVHLFAPFTWRLTSFDLIWPEHPIIYLLTLLGVAMLLYYGFKDWQKPVILTRHRARQAAAVFLFVLYLATPFLFQIDLVNADNRFATTLRNRAERPGKYLELDRSRFRRSDNTVLVFNGERIAVQGKVPEHDATISIKGSFIDTGIIHISELHVHSPIRNISSMVALAGILFVWLVAVWKKRVAFTRMP